MKNMGAFLKKYPVKWSLNVLYFIPVVLLAIGCVWMAVSGFKLPADQRGYYWGGIGVLLVLMVIFLVARVQALPKYYFELYENGLKIRYLNNKITDAIFPFEEIAEIWLFAIGNGRTPNYLAFRTVDGHYTVIPPKYNDSTGLLRKVVEQYIEVMNPVQETALTKGGRLEFPALPEDGVLALPSEKAILPYLEKSEKEAVSLDRFSLFDGKMAYALADISMAGIDTQSGNIIVKTVGGKVLYSRSYLSLCNADLFVRLVNDLSAKKNPKIPWMQRYEKACLFTDFLVCPFASNASGSKQ